MAVSVGIPNIKTTVKREALIAMLEKLVKEQKSEHAKRLADYEKAKAQYKRDVEVHVKTCLARLPRKLGEIAHRRGTRRLSDAIQHEVELEFPEYPDEPDKCGAGRYEHLIAQLKLSTDEELKLTPEDFRNFVRGDSHACRC